MYIVHIYPFFFLEWLNKKIHLKFIYKEAQKTLDLEDDLWTCESDV